MQTFSYATFDPISAIVHLDIGTVVIAAGDQARTTVKVSPDNPDDPCDMATARLARIGYAEGELAVSAPRAAGLSGNGAVIVDITLPSGSRLCGYALAADIHATGRLGECRLTAGCGQIRLTQTGSLHLSWILGNITVERVAGDLEITGTGNVSIREVDGAAEINRGVGDTWISEVTGNVRVYSESGDTLIGRAHAAVEVRAAQGGVRIEEALRGPLALDTAAGRIEVGIPDGVSAYLDLDSHVGTVYRSLDVLSPTPLASGTEDQPVTVHAHTIIGDVIVRRSASDSSTEWP